MTNINVNVVVDSKFIICASTKIFSITVFNNVLYNHLSTLWHVITQSVCWRRTEVSEACSDGGHVVFILQWRTYTCDNYTVSLMLRFASFYRIFQTLTKLTTSAELPVTFGKYLRYFKMLLLSPSLLRQQASSH